MVNHITDIIDLGSIELNKPSATGASGTTEVIYREFTYPSVVATFTPNSSAVKVGNTFLDDDSNVVKITVKATPTKGDPYSLQTLVLKLNGVVKQTITNIVNGTEYTFNAVTLTHGSAQTLQVYVTDEKLTGKTIPSATYGWGKYVYWGITTGETKDLTLTWFQSNASKALFGATGSKQIEFDCATTNGKPCFAIPHAYSNTKEVIQAYLGSMMYIDGTFIKTDNGYDIYSLPDNHTMKTKYGFAYPRN